jgi:hypothetical protein
MKYNGIIAYIFQGYFVLNERSSLDSKILKQIYASIIFIGNEFS